MKRDWIDVGRRPSGLCGAAILISARCHGFKRTTQQIVTVVNVCDETIRKRLDEFSKTDAANMTKEEFDRFVSSKGFDDNGMDPPCFKRQIEEDYQKFIQKKANEIDNIFNNTSDNKSEITTSQQTNLFQQSQNMPLLNVYNAGTKENVEIKYCLRRTNNRTWDKKEISKDFSKLVNEELSDIDEKEDYNFILTEEEYKLKAMIWDNVFKEWREEQKSKKEQEKKDLGRKRIRKLTVDNKKEEAKSPEEAIFNSKKFGKKLNKHRVENYLFKRSKIK
jgi:transcription factor IIIB subunit 2